MRAPSLLALAFLLVAGCDSSLSPGEPPSKASRGLPDWFAPFFVVDPRSATAPEIDGDEIVFRVAEGECSRVTDARGPSDCARGTARSVVTTGREWRLGEQYLISFEFWIDPRLRTRDYHNPRAVLAGRRSSRLSIARWSGNRPPDNQLFDLKVDATRGVTFLGRTCIPPSRFGYWHRFDMRIRWARDNTGYLEVRCHGDLYSGTPIFARSNFATNQPLHCIRANNCRPGIAKSPDGFEMQLGIIYEGGPRVSRLGPEGVAVRLRRVVERRLLMVFGREEKG